MAIITIFLPNQKENSNKMDFVQEPPSSLPIDSRGYKPEVYSPGNVVIEVRNLTKTYTMGPTLINALKDVTMDIYRGEYLSIMGPSGSGKSTLFNMIGALDKPTKGEVYLDNILLSSLDQREIAYIRSRKVGYIFQTFNLIGQFNALENVTLPMIFAGLPKSEYTGKGMVILEEVGLGDRYKHKPHELSGGQQQRVAIARALANDPSIILADEPTGNLDLTTGKDIIGLFKGIQEKRGVTFVVNTHDQKMLSNSDRIIWFEDGSIKRIRFRPEVGIEEGTIESKVQFDKN